MMFARFTRKAKSSPSATTLLLAMLAISLLLLLPCSEAKSKRRRRKPARTYNTNCKYGMENSVRSWNVRFALLFPEISNYTKEGF